MRKSFFSLFAVAAGLLASPARVFAADTSPVGTITIDLNKLEQRGKDCEIFFVITNASPIDYSALSPDIVMFRRDGVIDTQLNLNLGHIRPGPDLTSIKNVTLADKDCKSIGSVVIDDVVQCKSGAEELNNCFDRLVLKSTSQIQLTK